MDKAHIAALTLDEATFVRRSPDIERERAVAIRDLLSENSFQPVGDQNGPYQLHLKMEEDRLIFDIQGQKGGDEISVALGLQSFKRIIAEYFVVCESFFTAQRSAAPHSLEALDMGRKGLHNDGSELLKERLQGKIEIDMDTARRLFTLLCVLHIRVW